MAPNLLASKQLKLQPAIIWRWLCVGIITGFIVSQWASWFWWLSFLLIFVVAAAVYFNRKLILLGIFVVGFCLAMLRGNGLTPAPLVEDFIGQQEFIGQVTELPKLGQKTTKYIVTEQTASRKILLTALTWPEYNFGDRLKVSCDDVLVLAYKNYNNKGVWRECVWPKITWLDSDTTDPRYWLYQVRKLAGNKIKELVPEPFATLTTGMLWGDDSGLSPEIAKNFQRTGTTHLLAVSGFNVMVLTRVLLWFFIGLGLWRRQASVAVLLFTVIFVIFSGAEPSVVRAGIMGIILLIGQMIARQPNNFNVLAGTAAAMLMISPNLLIDLGWQLSFSAMVGLIYLAPLLKQRLHFLPEWLGMKQSAAETLAATLLTTPIILASIGQISVITPIANLLVAPVIVLVYWFGLSLLILSLAGQTVAAPAVWLLVAVQYYLTTVVGWLSSLAWASLVVSGITYIITVGVYLLLIWWLWFDWLKVKCRNISV